MVRLGAIWRPSRIVNREFCKAASAISMIAMGKSQVRIPQQTFFLLKIISEKKCFAIPQCSVKMSEGKNSSEKNIFLEKLFLQKVGSEWGSNLRPPDSSVCRQRSRWRYNRLFLGILRRYFLSLLNFTQCSNMWNNFMSWREETMRRCRILSRKVSVKNSIVEQGTGLNKPFRIFLNYGWVRITRGIFTIRSTRRSVQRALLHTTLSILD